MIAVPLEDGRVKLDLFEGPLDLLLYLIRKNEIDILDIPIVEVTQQYQALLDQARAHGLLDLDFAGEYFLMAATLIQIKSRMLLPRPPAGEDGAPVEDPRAELVQQLLEYERFREAAMMLHERAEIAGAMLPRPPWSVPELPPSDGVVDVDLLALARAFRKVLEDRRFRTPHVYEPSRFTVRDRIRHVVARLEDAGGALAFTTLFDEGTVEEAVVTFLALLELVKRGFVRCRQQGPEADIELALVPESERPAGELPAESEFDAKPEMEEDADAPSAEEAEVAALGDEGELDDPDDLADEGAEADEDWNGEDPGSPGEDE